MRTVFPYAFSRHKGKAVSSCSNVYIICKIVSKTFLYTVQHRVEFQVEVCVKIMIE